MPQIEEVSMEDRPRWLNTTEAATFLGVKNAWLERRRMKGSTAGGPPYTKLGGTVVYLKEDLLQYIENQKVTPESR